MSKIDELQDKIEEFNNKHVTKNKPPQKLYVKVFNIAIDLGAVILVGLVIGRWLDEYFAVKPFCLLCCLIISVMAALKIIIKNR
jgi:F0F1-type ATP synthase assembly protein I